MSLLQVVPQYCNAMNTSEEGRILMQIKKMEWIDTNNSLSSWNATDESPCSWNGVFCDTQLKVVTKLNLSNTNISGTLSSTICGLQNLKELILPGNFFGGPFPYGLLACEGLQTLDLSGNLFVGRLPHRIHELAELRHLYLEYNNFSGDIPPGFCMLPKLETLSLGNNQLTGTFPACLSNLTHLQELWLRKCGLEGEIHPSLGNLTELKSLDLAANRLSGKIPTSLMRLSRVTALFLWENQLSGQIPHNIDELRSIRNLDFSSNQLNGTIPERIVNLVHLENLALFENNLTGSVPAKLGRLVNLTSLNLSNNKLSGWLPQNLGTNSDIWRIDVSDNDFEGPLPRNLCKGGILFQLVIFSNNFSGSLPPFDSCSSSLQYAQLYNNQLSGEVPSTLWSCQTLVELKVDNNLFEGRIPVEIGGANKLKWLQLDKNRFSGMIPPQIGQLRNLVYFSASNNRLFGPLPDKLAGLSSINYLQLDHNSLSGGIPNGIISLTRLSHLNLGSNRLTGKISPSLGSMSTLNFLDLSNNLLTGEIPPELGRLRLDIFNVSGNQLSGSIPAIFKNLAYNDSFLGNPNLCEDTSFGFRIRSCFSKKRDSLSHHYLPIILVPILVLAMAIMLFWCLMNNGIVRNFFVRKPSSSRSWEVTAFHLGLEVNGSYILKQLTEGNVIGSGATGKVYKACLRNGQEVAVKKISNRGNEFEAEVDTLREIRHSNILKLLCCISSAESDFKLLVFEYIENGNLFDCLHGGSESMQALGWPVRHKIAVGVARGLCYLHHDCKPPILHRDVKSSNILVDSQFEAKIADFGVSKKLLSRHQPGTGEEYGSGFTGSPGYIAPEYAYGRMKVSEKSDVYSFGVVLLELVSGKRATGEAEYGESLDIAGWMLSKLSRREEEEELPLGVLDRRIIEGEDESTNGCTEQMLRMLAVGLHCINRVPNRRPSMKKVLDMLQSVGTRMRRNAEDDVVQWEEAGLGSNEKG
eukprot:PITA_16781